MPESVEQLLRRGMEAVSQRRNAEAYLLFSRAAEVEPENVEALLWKAGFTDDPWEAEAILEHVLELDPENSRARVGLEWVKAKLVSEPPLEAAVPPRTGPDEVSLGPRVQRRARQPRRPSRRPQVTRGMTMIGGLLVVAAVSLGMLALFTHMGRGTGASKTPVELTPIGGTPAGTAAAGASAPALIDIAASPSASPTAAPAFTPAVVTAAPTAAAVTVPSVTAESGASTAEATAPPVSTSTPAKKPTATPVPPEPTAEVAPTQPTAQPTPETTSQIVEPSPTSPPPTALPTPGDNLLVN